MTGSLRALALGLFTVLVLTACSGGGGSDQPPPPVDTTMDWNDDNWDAKDWQ